MMHPTILASTTSRFASTTRTLRTSQDASLDLLLPDRVLPLGNPRCDKQWRLRLRTSGGNAHDRAVTAKLICATTRSAAPRLGYDSSSHLSRRGS